MAVVDSYYRYSVSGASTRTCAEARLVWVAAQSEFLIKKHVWDASSRAEGTQVNFVILNGM